MLRTGYHLAPRSCAVPTATCRVPGPTSSRLAQDVKAKAVQVATPPPIPAERVAAAQREFTNLDHTSHWTKLSSTKLSSTVKVTTLLRQNRLLVHENAILRDALESEKALHKAQNTALLQECGRLKTAANTYKAQATASWWDFADARKRILDSMEKIDALNSELRRERNARIQAEARLEA